MATTLKFFKKCARNRKEPLVVILNLLMFLAVCTRAVSSVPLEERNFQIPALGRISQLGSLYDARTDSFSDTSIFVSDLPSHLITTTNTPRVNKKSEIVKKESDKFKIFGVDLDTAASIQTGILQPRGAASLMSEDMTGSNGVTGIYLQTFQTAKQTFSILQGELRNYYHTDFQMFEGATHIVTGMHWGCNIAVKFTDIPLRKQTSAQRGILLGKEMAKLKKASGNISNKTLSFEMHLTSDVTLQNALPAPTSLRQIQDQIDVMQDSIEVTNSGLGLPLKFTLTPIYVLKKYFNSTTTTTETRAYKPDERILREYFQIIDDIKSTGKTLTNFEDNSNCVSNEVHKEFEEIQTSFITVEQDFNILFKNVVLDVKSGDANNSALSEVLKNYKKQDFNPKFVQNALTLHDQARLKVEFCSQLNEEYPDIEYFGSASNLISKIYQNHNKTTYVLFTKSELKENDRVSYEDNLNIFLDLLYKPSNALFIVDCDFNYTQCESINGTVIKQIRKAKYTFDDVRLEIKITEIGNKTKIVECNKESGMTGAFCVSTITGASHKLGRKKPNKSKKLPTESRSSKVAGGKAARRSEFPFQILFPKSGGDVRCGGSIIDENFVLTAAHCFYDGAYRYDAADYESWTIVAGDHNRSLYEGSEQRRRIRDVHIHENYIPIADVNDIAIVRLDHPLQWSPHVQQILLPAADYEASGDAVVTGWGRLRVGGVNPNVLQKVTVPIVDRADCVEAYAKRQVFVSIKMMCAGDVVDGGVDACHGDSGGPLSFKLGNGSSVLIGVVSGGIGCASAEYPGIYMQVSKYVDWISETLAHFEFVTDDCLADEREPCLNGGICVDAINSFKCVCAAGYQGLDCATVTNNCARSKPCLNGGTCVNGINSYSCVCAAGYQGLDCATVTNNCARSKPCLNGGTCVNGINSYSCVCAAGYQGLDCATVTNNCARSEPCLNGGTCVNGINSYSCVCATGYQGLDCATVTNNCARSESCLNGGTCVNGINSYSCVCAAGYEGPDCATVTNNCALSVSCLNGGTCINKIGNYSCACAEAFAGNHCEKLNKCDYPGTCARPSEDGICRRCKDGFFKVAEDDTRCSYANENTSLIISTNRQNLIMISLDGQKVTQIAKNDNVVYGTDYNFRANTIFWFCNWNSKFYTAPISGEAEQQITLHESLGVILGLAVDWIHLHLYWVDFGRGHVAVSNFNGTMKKVLFSDGLNFPQSIAVNPLNGWMYWTDAYTNQIERAGLDGSRREVILSTNIEYPTGLVIDFVDSQLYWSQGEKPASIWSSNFDGSDRKLIFTPNPSQFFSSYFRKIATFDKYIYFIEYQSKTIYKFNKCNGKELGMIYKSILPNSGLTDLKIYDVTVQPDGENLCSKRIGRCSHFCFPVPAPGKGSVFLTTCACPDGLTLSADKLNCA